MKMIDSHCHLHDSEFYPDNREEVYQQTAAVGIGMICVGTDERSSREAVEFAKGRPDVWPVVGVHPHEAKDGWADVEALLKEHSSIVGIGEIGLDYFYDFEFREGQMELLRGQLKVAKKLSLLQQLF